MSDGNFPQTVSISQVQKDEISRFVELKIFTSDADAIRRMLDDATESVHQKYGLKPLPLNRGAKNVQ